MMWRFDESKRAVVNHKTREAVTFQVMSEAHIHFHFDEWGVADEGTVLHILNFGPLLKVWYQRLYPEGPPPRFRKPRARVGVKV